MRLDDFLRFQDESQFADHKNVYKNIVRAFSRLGIQVRFIGVELNLDDDVHPVESPKISEITSPVVAAALSDAETMISNGNFLGTIDRVHTALHGYARSCCAAAGLVGPGETVELPRAIKLLRENHPNLKAVGPHKEHVEKVLKSMGAICDTLGTIRNHGSLAHANENLLTEAEALLVANSGRTVLRYLIDKIENPSP